MSSLNQNNLKKPLERNNEDKNKRDHSKSLFRSTKNKLVRFAAQLGSKPESDDPKHEGIESHNSHLKSNIFRRSYSQRSEEDQLRKQLFRRSLGTKLEKESNEYYTPQLLRKGFTLQSMLANNKRTLSNNAILDVLQRESDSDIQRLKSCSSPKPKRPPTLTTKSSSRNSFSQNGSKLRYLGRLAKQWFCRKKESLLEKSLAVFEMTHFFKVTLLLVLRGM